MVWVWALFVWCVQATHLLWVQPVSLNLTTPLLTQSEVIPLSCPLAVPSNHRLAVVFEFLAPVNRTYLGAANTNSAECALQHNANASFVNCVPTLDLYMQWNSGPSTMLQLLALVSIPVTYSGFGQTLSTGSTTSLTSVTLALAAGMTSGNSANATMRIYDIEPWNTAENIVFPFAQETSSPTTRPTQPTTPRPTLSPTQPTTSHPSLSPTKLPTTTPSRSPAKQPSSLSPTVLEGYFGLTTCPNVLFPNLFRNISIVCQMNQAPIPFVSDSIAVSPLQQVDAGEPQLAFSPPVVLHLAIDREDLLEDPAYLDGTYQLVCAWFRPDSTMWSLEGVTRVGTDSTCLTSHFTTFALILHRTTCLSCRTNSQLVCLSMAFLIAFLSFCQMVRVVYSTQTCFTCSFVIHSCIWLASVAIGIIAALFPVLAPTHPGVLVILSSLVTLIELAAYMTLIYVWVVPMFTLRNSVLSYRITCAFWILYAVMAVGIVTIPIIILFGNGKEAWAKGGAYFMCVLSFLTCCVLGSSGCVVSCQLSQPGKKRNSFMQHYCTISRRLRVGSMLLAASLLLQSVLWITSIRESILQSPLMSQLVEDGFYAAAFVTFLTMLFLFCFGIKERPRSKTPPRSVLTATPDPTLRSTTLRLSEEDKSSGIVATQPTDSRRASIELLPPSVSVASNVPIPDVLTKNCGTLPHQAFFGSKPPSSVFTFGIPSSTSSPRSEPETREYFVPGAEFGEMTEAEKPHESAAQKQAILVDQVRYYDVNDLKIQG